jgi:hypothetical protein
MFHIARHGMNIQLDMALTPCSLGLSATIQQYFSLTSNQPQATSQQYSSLRTNQHQPSATSQPNKLLLVFEHSTVSNIS